MKITIEADAKKMSMLLNGAGPECSEASSVKINFQGVADAIQKALRQDPLIRKRIVEGFRWNR